MTVLIMTLGLCISLVTGSGQSTDDQSVLVETVDGESYQGGVVSWSDDWITLSVEDRQPRIAADRLLRVLRQVPDRDRRRGPIAVELLDGSRLSATSVRAEGDGAILETPFGRLTCPLQSIHTIRWLSAKTDQDTAWDEMKRNEFEGDAIILQRDANHLDFVEGTVRAISDKAVTFQLDDQSLDLPLARLAGIVFFRPAGTAPTTGRFRLATRDGSSLQGNRLALANGQLQIRTASDIPLSVPLTELAEVLFSTDNLVYLSDLEPEQMDVEPLVAPSISGEWVLATLYRPRINKAFADRALQLQFTDEIAPRTYAKGIALHSRSRLVYRLDQPFRRLRGLIGWDPEGGTDGGAVQVTIRAGKEIIFENLWNPGEPPVEIDLPIADARRIELFVDYGDDSDAGDRVHFCNLRLLK